MGDEELGTGGAVDWRGWGWWCVVAGCVADDVMPVVGPARVVGWSGSEFVLVNQPTEHVASVDRWRRSLAVGCCGIRRIEFESAMMSSAVVMIDVLGEDRLDVASTEDQEVVQAVFSDGASPAFGKRVRPWGA